MYRTLNCPEPTCDDFVVHVPSNKWFLCDAHVHPIRSAVQAIIDGADAPLEWLCLPNVAAAVLAYRKLRDAVVVYRLIMARIEGGPSPDAPLRLREMSYGTTSEQAAEAVFQARWALVCTVTEGFYGDAKYRAANLHRKKHRDLLLLAREHKVRKYSRLTKRQLVYTLVSLGL